MATIDYDVSAAGMPADYARYEERDGDGPVRVRWIEDGQAADWECDGTTAVYVRMPPELAETLKAWAQGTTVNAAIVRAVEQAVQS